MLRKRTRSLQKDQNQMGHHHHVTMSDSNSDYYSQSHAFGRNMKGNSIFNVPCLFVGLDPKGLLLDTDSVRSPTSPLDAKFPSNLGNPLRNTRSLPHEGNQRSWDCCKVGLSIVESLEDCSRFSGNILRSPESKKIGLISPQMMIKTPFCTKTYRDSFETSKSLPKDFCKVASTQKGSLTHKGESSVLFEIGETGLENDGLFGKSRSCSLDSCSPLTKNLSGLANSNAKSETVNFALIDEVTQLSQNSKAVSLCSSNEFIKSLSASEIELSEDYTCVISHGPNPKTTHIFGDCILETHPNGFKNYLKHEEKEKGVTLVGNTLQTPHRYPSSDFLSFCHHCNKKLEEGKDIYIYGGEKGFCSLTCRAMEIIIDEELEKSNLPSEENSPKEIVGDQIFETGIFTET